MGGRGCTVGYSSPRTISFDAPFSAVLNPRGFDIHHTHNIVQWEGVGESENVSEMRFDTLLLYH